MMALSWKFLSSAAFAVAGLTALSAGARAEELIAYQGRSVALEAMRGTIYYAPDSGDFLVVITVDHNGQPMRFVTALKPGQKAKISTPAAPGGVEKAVELRREGDRFFIEELPLPNPAEVLQSKAHLTK